MSDYLSPGVYVEELPPQLRAIEGVSTSTAGFVGAAARGAAPGFPLPFTPGAGDPQPVTIVPTPTPVACFSFSDFTNQFGNPLPLPDPTDTAYLGYAVMGFFSNGGQIVYIARVTHYDITDLANSASYGWLRLSQGNVLRLQADAQVPAATLSFIALRGVSAGATLSFFNKNGSVVTIGGSPLTATVSTYTSQTSPPTITLSSPLPTAAIPLVTAANVYVTTDTLTTQGPTFWARNPGSWSGQISVTVTPSRRRAVAVTIPVASTATEIQVASTTGFYQGAIIEVDTGTQQLYPVVASVGAGGILGLTAPLGVAITAAATVRIAEVDITVVDPSLAVPVTETYTQLTWNPDPNPNVRLRHYSTVINAQSQLVYVQPPGVGGANGSEGPTLTLQPATFNGWPLSITSAVGVFDALTSSLAATLLPALQAVAAAGPALQTAVIDLVTGTLPVTAASAPVIAVTGAATTLTNAATALADLVTAATVAPGSPGAALTAAATAAVSAANAAVAAATGTPDGAVAEAEISPQTLATAAQLGVFESTVTTQLAMIPAAFPSTSGLALFGADGIAPTDDDYVGQDNGPGQRSGIQSLKDAENVSIIAAPGQTFQDVQDALINQCERLLNRVAVLDGEQNPAGGSVNAILAHRDNYDTSYAAYYAPWLQITLNNQNLYIPPSGHMVGIYAGTDASRGVWKAPANVVVQGITGLKTYIVKGEQDLLNPVGVNAIRRFDTLGTRVWGARTLSSDNSLIYVNVRRTLIYLEASIDQGTQWVVFEPNTPDTWDRLSDSVTAFLTTQWANGALFGAKPSDAFFVRCGETTMTADDIQNGRLICLIGVAIVRPAEFVIFRIEQTTGYANQ